MQAHPIAIRESTAADRPELERLASLDSGHLPHGPLLVAEIHGKIEAAVPLGDGRPLADPFHPTAELVDLLETRAAQLRHDRSRVQRRLALVPRLPWAA